MFMNTKNGRTNELHRFRSRLADKLNLKYFNNNMALANFSFYYTWKNYKYACNNNKFEIYVPTWNDGFDLSDGS